MFIPVTVCVLKYFTCVRKLSNMFVCGRVRVHTPPLWLTEPACKIGNIVHCASAGGALLVLVGVTGIPAVVCP